MLIRKKGNIVRVLRAEPPKNPATRERPPEQLLGAFRGDEPVPAALLETLTRDERKTLMQWLAVYRESEARRRARSALAKAPDQLDALVNALETAADTLSAADADLIWVQLQAIARTLRRAGHPRPQPPRQPPEPVPGQQDFFGTATENEHDRETAI